MFLWNVRFVNCDFVNYRRLRLDAIDTDHFDVLIFSANNRVVRDRFDVINLLFRGEFCFETVIYVHTCFTNQTMVFGIINRLFFELMMN